LRTLALLKPGVTPKQVQDELTAITDRLKQQYPVDNAKHTAPRVLTLRDEVIGGYGALLWTLLGAVGIVLFTACTNLANMLLVRSAARQKDFAIRSALGGSRSQLTRELMTAGLLIAGTGGALGLALARWGVRLLVAIGPADLPRAREIALDWHVFAFTCCISLIVGVVFGLTPALQANRIDINHTLKAGGRSDGEDASGRRLRRILVVSEVALSLLLLVGAGLLIRSFVKLQSISVGADTRNVLSVRVSLPAPKYAQSETMNAFVNALVESIQKLPGVDSASVASILPLSGMNTRADFIVAGHPPATEAERPAAQNRWVAPDYFRTMRIPILRGREFGPFDTSRSQPVAVIDAALAERYFRDENPLGQHLEVTDSGPSARTVEIIGVVGNVKHFSLDDSPIPTYYSPLAQVAQPALGFLINGVSLVARTGQNPRANAELVRREIQLLDPNVPASAVQTMEQLLAASVAARRFNLLLIDVFAVMALLLAAMGIYSVVSCTVAQRRREIGIRMALGASSRNVFREILREGMQLTAIGTALGLIAALLSTRFLAGLLFAVTPTDPLTFATITAMIAATSFLACFIPARRATSVDATTALRSE
jgi:putative ABC transport system permease protein